MYPPSLDAIPAPPSLDLSAPMTGCGTRFSPLPVPPPPPMVMDLTLLWKFWISFPTFWNVQSGK